ncbi:acyl carrier protein [Candidatus Nitrospira inopinata]|jgi:acyl carrier protein|uniref:Acyl carrier protein n=1 Tax=Candidatus Nitrospira inopinata TaxID=1715989 RepID=A0A0S4KSU0_9BACT|nr:acyl carrier protein [Candidatus Nitrospira inopinata]CUQ67537.1 Acyl carrier protein (modular protein) [Candidatus Nitrospira inopinata]
MTELEVTSQIIQALATYLKRDPSTITESHHLRDDLGLDSVAIIELLFEIEDRFKIQIPDQDLPGLSTVGSVAAYVHQRLTTGQASVSAETKPAAAPKKPTGTGAKRSATVSKKPAAGRKPPTALKKRAAAPKKVTVAKAKKR